MHTPRAGHRGCVKRRQCRVVGDRCIAGSYRAAGASPPRYGLRPRSPVAERQPFHVDVTRRVGNGSTCWQEFRGPSRSPGDPFTGMPRPRPGRRSRPRFHGWFHGGFHRAATSSRDVHGGTDVIIGGNGARRPWLPYPGGADQPLPLSCCAPFRRDVRLPVTWDGGAEMAVGPGTPRSHRASPCSNHPHSPRER